MLCLADRLVPVARASVRSRDWCGRTSSGGHTSSTSCSTTSRSLTSPSRPSSRTPSRVRPFLSALSARLLSFAPMAGRAYVLMRPASAPPSSQLSRSRSRLPSGRPSSSTRPSRRSSRSSSVRRERPSRQSSLARPSRPTRASSRSVGSRLLCVLPSPAARRVVLCSRLTRSSSSPFAARHRQHCQQERQPRYARLELAPARWRVSFRGLPGAPRSILLTPLPSLPRPSSSRRQAAGGRQALSTIPLPAAFTSSASCTIIHANPSLSSPSWPVSVGSLAGERWLLPSTAGGIQRGLGRRGPSVAPAGPACKKGRAGRRPLSAQEGREKKKVAPPARAMSQAELAPANDRALRRPTNQPLTTTPLSLPTLPPSLPCPSCLSPPVRCSSVGWRSAAPVLLSAPSDLAADRRPEMAFLVRPALRPCFARR